MGNQRTIVVRADPDRLSSYRISPDELMRALAQSNTLTPAGSVRMGDQLLITPQNTVVALAEMLPNGLGLGEGGEQVAPLSIAVIGGLLASTLSTLLFLPVIYQSTIGKNACQDVSLL